MKKVNLLFSYSCLIVIVLMSSCSEVRYSHLNKILREKPVVDKQLVINELQKAAKLEEVVSAPQPVSAVTEDPCNSEDAIFSAAPNVNEVKEGVNNEKKEQAVKSDSKKKEQAVKSDSKKDLALKIMSKLPNKLKASFAEKKNIADHSQTSDRSLIWTIIVIILILWLLGFLLGGGGPLGGLIHLLLVIAVVLIILRLLGLI